MSDANKTTAETFASLDAHNTPPSIDDDKKEVPSAAALTTSLRDGDEALTFLSNHPRAAEIAAQGQAILEDDAARRRLLRKIDWTITPLLAGTYFLQFLDKNTLSYTSVMGIREDVGLKGQEYSHVSMLFYIGEFVLFLSGRKRGWCFPHLFTSPSASQLLFCVMARG